MIFSKSANERLWASLLKETLIIRAENELQELKETAVPHNASDGCKKSLRKIFSRAGRKEAARGIIKSSFRFLTSAAAVVGILFGVLLTQDEVYAAVKDVLVRSVHPAYDNYSSSDTKITVYSDEVDFNDNIRLGYIPEGYELRTVTYLGNRMFIIYETNDDEKMYFEYFTIYSSYSINLDNEHNNYSTFVLDGIEYNYYESTDPDFGSYLLWNNDEYIYLLDAGLSKEEIIRIVQNLTY